MQTHNEGTGDLLIRYTVYDIGYLINTVYHIPIINPWWKNFITEWYRIKVPEIEQQKLVGKKYMHYTYVVSGR